MFDLFKTKLYFKIFLSYVVSFIVPFLIINFLTFSISSNSYKNDMSALKLKYSENYKYNLDSQLAEITLTSNLLSRNPQIWSFCTQDRNVDYTEFIYSAKIVANSIDDHFRYKASHNSIALYFPSQSCIITPESIYNSLFGISWDSGIFRIGVYHGFYKMLYDFSWNIFYQWPLVIWR